LTPYLGLHVGLARLSKRRGDEESALTCLVRVWELKEHACREVEGPEGDDVELADIYMELNRTYEKLGQLK